jgi:L-aspartate oxidase
VAIGKMRDSSDNKPSWLAGIFLMQTLKTPVIIIGSGIAGLFTALKLAEREIESTVITKATLQDNSSWMAQGGIAAVLPENTADSVELHVQDTLHAGAGLAIEGVARSIVSESALVIEDLLQLGVPFDKENGRLAFTKEAAHSTNRILHAGGDATGRSIQDTLIEAVKQNELISFYENTVALKLWVEENPDASQSEQDGLQCYGAIILHDNKPLLIKSEHTVLATGGIGQLYWQTTNPPVSTGDGIALAFEAGAKVRDLEFVQFHPTAFWKEGQVKFLISEALRGEGGLLVNPHEEQFADSYHPDAEMAPRDIVTRAIWSEMKDENIPHVYLDIRHLEPSAIESRFPSILKMCANFGVDIRKDLIPVAPAAHYAMGGVLVDDSGKTTIKSLYAVGEVVSSGIHGANRLASNSLLECVVLARRVAQAISENPPITLPARSPEYTAPVFKTLSKVEQEELDGFEQQLKQIMWENVGVIRQEKSLKMALRKIRTLFVDAQAKNVLGNSAQGVIFRMMLVTARLICQGALQRQESRGAHFRSDFDEPCDLVGQHAIQQDFNQCTQLYKSPSLTSL